MNGIFEVYKCDKTRREVLIKLCDMLDNTDELSNIVGMNPVLDCALSYIAENNPQWESNLNKVLNTKQLHEDIIHVINSNGLRKQRNNTMR